MMMRSAQEGDSFVFSAINFFDSEQGALITSLHRDARTRWYGRALRLARLCPTAGFGLLGQSLTVTTSNFFFNRALFEKLRGFNGNLLLSHDWDFALRATLYTEPVFVPEPSLTYRCHASNTYTKLQDVHRSEGRAVLERYFELVSDGTPNPLAPSRDNWPTFFDYFCGQVVPWFASDPLICHLPDAVASGELRQRRSTTRSRTFTPDAVAVDRMQAELSRQLSVEEVSTALWNEIACHWDDVRRSLNGAVADGALASPG
jgi:hypothetical protein